MAEPLALFAAEVADPPPEVHLVDGAVPFLPLPHARAASLGDLVSFVDRRQGFLVAAIEYAVLARPVRIVLRVMQHVFEPMPILAPRPIPQPRRRHLDVAA